MVEKANSISNMGLGDHSIKASSMEIVEIILLVDETQNNISKLSYTS